MSDASKPTSLPGEPPASKQGLNRHQMVGRMLAAGSGVFLLPKVGPSLSLPKFAGCGGLPPTTKEFVDATWKPAFLDLHQDATMIALAELILPGSRQAQVNHTVDSLLAVDTQENQRRFLDALLVMDAISIKRFGHPFQALKDEQQHEILRVISTSDRGQPEADTRWSWFMIPQKLPRLRDHFEHLKTWIARTYLATETGMKDLGWTSTYLYPVFPRCKPSSENC